MPAAAQASVLVLPVAIDSRANSGWSSTPPTSRSNRCDSVDPLRPVAHVRANAVEVTDDRVLSNLSRADARALMSTLLSAEAVGVARWATDTATEYAKIREQFGRPIGQFQAVKHKCARDDRVHRTRHRRGVGRRARHRRGEPGPANAADAAGAHVEFAAAVAATLAPAAAQQCTQDCIQVHGGIGFTWEHDTNVYYRRALLLAACFGRAADYPQRVVDTATTTGMRGIDIDLDPDTEKLRDEIRAEVAALKAIPRDRAHRRDRRGRLGATAPAQAVGPGRGADRADHHRPGVSRRPGQATADRASRRGSSRRSSRSAPTNRSSGSCRPPSAAK